MKNLKKMGIMLLFFISLSLCMNQESLASGDLFLNQLDLKAQIEEDGSMKVVETWDIKIEETNTLYKTFKTDTSQYSGMKDVTVKDITKGANQPFRQINQLMYHVTKGCYYGMKNKDGDFEIAWGVGLDNSRGNKKYQISYTVEDVISKYLDCAELYWQFVGENFEISSNQVTGTITLPSYAKSKEEIRVWGHTEDLNGEIYVTDTNQIEFTVNHFNSGRYIEIRTLFPTEMITSAKKEKNVSRVNEVIKEETKWVEEANRKRARRDFIHYGTIFVIDVILIGISIIFIRNMIRRIKKIKEKKKWKPTQNIIYFREMPRENATPAEAVYVWKKIKTGLPSTEIGKIFSATLLDLNLKKMIDFQVTKEKRNKDVITIKLIDETALANLESQDEKEIANFLISAMKTKKSNEITVKDLQKYIQNSSSKILTLQRKIEEGAKQGLAKNQLTNQEQRVAYKKVGESNAGYLSALIFSITFGVVLIAILGSATLIGLVPFWIMALINVILTSIEMNRINIYTQKGVDETEKWKGLKKYMEEFSLLDQREVPEIAIWEKFLVYATAFGIADKVLKQLKIVYPDMESSMDVNTYSYMYLMMHTDFSRSFSNSISSSMSSAYSSASGGGGGFSGGGGGGRWPEVVAVEDNRHIEIKQKR